MKDYFPTVLRTAVRCLRAARQGLFAQPVMSEISVFKERQARRFSACAWDARINKIYARHAM